jgi:hypothetical protein
MNVPADVAFLVIFLWAVLTILIIMAGNRNP